MFANPNSRLTLVATQITDFWSFKKIELLLSSAVQFQNNTLILNLHIM